MLIYLQILETDEEKDQFVKLYEKYHNMMLSIAMKLTKNNLHLSQDIVHDTFMSVMNHLDKITDVDSMYTASYMYTSVRNKFYNTLRKRNGNDNIDFTYQNGEEIKELQSSSSVIDSLNIIISEESYRNLIRCIKKLKPTYRDILALELIHELTDEEICKRNNISMNNLYVRRHRAKEALKKILAADGYDFD